MSDMGDDFRAWKLHKRAKKEKNLEHSTRLLQESGIPFESKNWGVHLIVQGNSGLIDFWPSTGKFIARSGAKGRGVRNLIKHAKHQPDARLMDEAG